MQENGTHQGFSTHFDLDVVMQSLPKINSRPHHRLFWAHTRVYKIGTTTVICVCVCVFFQFILNIKFVGRTSRGHTGEWSQRISHPPSFRGACLNFSRE